MVANISDAGSDRWRPYLETCSSHSHEVYYCSWVMSHTDSAENHKLTHQMLSKGQPQLLSDALRYNPCGLCKGSSTIFTWILGSLMNDLYVFALLMQCSEHCTTEYISVKWEITWGQYLLLEKQHVPSVWVFFFSPLH